LAQQHGAASAQERLLEVGMAGPFDRIHSVLLIVTSFRCLSAHLLVLTEPCRRAIKVRARNRGVSTKGRNFSPAVEGRNRMGSCSQHQFLGASPCVHFKESLRTQLVTFTG